MVPARLFIETRFLSRVSGLARGPAAAGGAGPIRLRAAGSVEPDAASAELWAPGLGFARRNAFEGDQSPQKQSKTDAPSLTGRTEAVK